MKIFLDANVITAALIRTDPIYDYAVRILSLPRTSFQFYTSSVSLAIAFYFASKKYSNRRAKHDIELLSQFLTITQCGVNEVTKALADRRVEDFEDGLQYYSALTENCTCIVTEDLLGFYFSTIEIMDCRTFLKRHENYLV